MHRMMMAAVLSASALSPVISHSAVIDVVLPRCPAVWETTAGEELSTYLSKRIGDGFVRIGGKPAVFHVGDTAFARARGVDCAKLAEEEWIIRSFEPDVVLAGGGSRGTIYAVYRFLEDFCGVRWWYDGEEDVPDAASLDLPVLDVRGRPHFRYRDIYRNFDKMSRTDPRTAARNRVNGNGLSVIPAAFGGGFVFGPPYHCHTWDRLLPFAVYGKTHPEWYSLRDGKRVGGQREGLLCLTAPGLMEAFVARVEEMIAKGEADARKKGLCPPTIYDISQNDSGAVCQCDACEAETAVYGRSGMQLRFENEVARRLGEKHPELVFSVFAYTYSEPVPSNGVVAADNVVVKLCNTKQNLASSIHAPENAYMHDLLPAWRKFAKNLYVWEYSVAYGATCHGLPFPSEFHTPEKCRYYAENGVTGILFEHEERDVNDMPELKYWLEAKMMEDPLQDPRRLLETFMSGYFGPAGEHVFAARRLLERRRAERKPFIGFFPVLGDFNYVDAADLVEMNRLYDAAEAAVANDARRLRRVRRARANLVRLAEVRRIVPSLSAPVPGVCDQPFYEFRASVTNLFKVESKAVAFADDPDAAGGQALRVLDHRKSLDLPLVGGLYNKATRKTLERFVVHKPSGKGWQWYDLGIVRIPDASYYFFFMRTWGLQLPGCVDGLRNQSFRVRIRLKFTGPTYFPESSDPDAIWFDRVLLVPVRGH